MLPMLSSQLTFTAPPLLLAVSPPVSQGSGKCLIVGCGQSHIANDCPHRVCQKHCICERWMSLQETQGVNCSLCIPHHSLFLSRLLWFFPHHLLSFLATFLCPQLLPPFLPYLNPLNHHYQKLLMQDLILISHPNIY